MKIHPNVDSSFIRHLIWDEDNCNLAVMFTSGSMWIYYNIHSFHYERLLTAPSIGGYFNTHIRNLYNSDKLPYNDALSFINGVHFAQEEQEEE